LYQSKSEAAEGSTQDNSRTLVSEKSPTTQTSGPSLINIQTTGTSLIPYVFLASFLFTTVWFGRKWWYWKNKLVTLIKVIEGTSDQVTKGEISKAISKQTSFGKLVKKTTNRRK